MANDQHKISKEERLAAKLRENLRRRKVQARALDANPSERKENSAAAAENSPPAALPKDPAKS